MIIKQPVTDYDIKMYDILTTDLIFKTIPDGEKAIVYDLAHYVQERICFNWDTMDLRHYLYELFATYNDHKGSMLCNVICYCINKLFPKRKAKVVTDKFGIPKLICEGGIQ